MNIQNTFLNSYNRDIESAYIITLKNNHISERLAKRCAESCMKVEMPFKLWQAFDGTGDDVVVPENLKNQDYLTWLKRPNDRYSNSQLGVFYSHFSLWAHCATIDQPIIILEHDAIMLNALKHHGFYNCIQYLGSAEQVAGSPVYSIPPHGSIYNGNWRFICRAHAYAIDPPVARNLLSYAIREGITKTLDVFIRCDIFPIIQNGLYAYDLKDISTIQEKEDYTMDA